MIRITIKLPTLEWLLYNLRGPCWRPVAALHIMPVQKLSGWDNENKFKVVALDSCLLSQIPIKIDLMLKVSQLTLKLFSWQKLKRTKAKTVLIKQTVRKESIRWYSVLRVRSTTGRERMFGLAGWFFTLYWLGPYLLTTIISDNY